MSAQTKIEWTDRTWNCARGCSRISPGCGQGGQGGCYAERQAIRQAKPGQAYHGLVRSTPSGPRWTGKVQLVEESLLEPLSWRKPQRIFVNSMSDLFHEGLSNEQIDRVFAVMALAPRHTFQVLTKRPVRMRAYLTHPETESRVKGRAWEMLGKLRKYRHADSQGRNVIARPWPLPNVWLGVSVEDQQRAAERIPLLLETPAAVRFLSVEPLLGPVALRPWLTACTGRGECADGDIPWHDNDCHAAAGHAAVDWVIVGGESGPGARPCDVAWIRSIVEQCRAAGVACFVKQLGAFPHFKNDGAGWAESWPDGGGRHWRWDEALVDGLHVYAQYDRKGGEPAEWPEDLRVREFPRG